EVLRGQPADIVMLGDSLTHFGEWGELLDRPRVANRGVGMDTTRDVLDRIDAVTALRPRVLFLMIGINDLLDGSRAPDVAARTEHIVAAIHATSPSTRIVIESVLPVRHDREDRRVDAVQIDALNALLRDIAARTGSGFVDVA